MYIEKTQRGGNTLRLKMVKNNKMVDKSFPPNDKSLEEIKLIIEDLLSDKFLFNQISQNATQLGLSYDWKLKIKEWQDAILTLTSK